VGKFAEITVNIYFRHSSVHGNVEMFFPVFLSALKALCWIDTEFLNHRSYAPCLNLQLNAAFVKMSAGPRKQSTLK
jgi:nitric oxide reductase large subunit